MTINGLHERRAGEPATYRCANALAKTTLVEPADSRRRPNEMKTKDTDGRRNIQEESGRRKTFRWKSELLRSVGAPGRPKRTEV